jgi:hypothetical protein
VRSARRDILRSLVTHRPDHVAILERYYGYGVEDIDATEVLFAEGGYASVAERN